MNRKYKRPEARMAMALALIVVALASITMARGERRGRDGERAPDTLYVWTGDQARVAPDFLAVIDFDEESPHYGRVIRTVPVPGPGSAGNEPHHCHLSADKNILACGGLLALLRGQNSIFFFDVSKPRDPKFMFSTSGTLSNITDDFLPLERGGFLVTQMGDHAGGTPGRVAEFDGKLHMVAEWPDGSAGARFQPARHLGAPRSQPDGDVRLHDARELVEHRPRRSAAARKHPRLGSEETNDRAHGHDPERDWHHGRQADP
jgi:hypothetical protein